MGDSDKTYVVIRSGFRCFYGQFSSLLKIEFTRIARLPVERHQVLGEKL